MVGELRRLAARAPGNGHLPRDRSLGEPGHGAARALGPVEDHLADPGSLHRHRQRYPAAGHLHGREAGVLRRHGLVALGHTLAGTTNVCKTAGVADERVQSAIAHWAPRFIANGVDASDFSRVTAGIARWEDWCQGWCAAAEVYEDLGRAALARGRRRSAGAQLARAAVYYHFAKFLFVQDLEQMRAAHQRAVRCLADALPDLDPPGHRVTVPLGSSEMVGVLRLPSTGGPHPVVVLIAGLDSAKEEFRSTEALFLERGLATFAVDGPGQGEAEYALPIRPDWEVPGAAILDALSALPAIDADRVGLWGVSLGGYYAPRWASADDRVRACIALAGPYDFGEGWDRLPALTREAFRVRARCASDAEAARRAGELTLAGRADRIRAPLQIVFGKQDRLIPWAQAARLAREASGPVDLLLFEDGNHVCTNISWHHRLRSADWMAEQLRARPHG